MSAHEIPGARQSYPVKEIVAAIREGRSGIVEGTRAGAAVLGAVTRIEQLGWHFVVLADRRALEGSAGQ